MSGILTIGVFTDVHWGTFDVGARRCTDGIGRLAKCIDAFNDAEVDMVICLGDLINSEGDHDGSAAMLSEVRGICDGLRCELHILPGNHDITRRNRAAALAIYKQKYGKLLTEVQYNGVAFIGVYTEPLVKGFKLESFDPLKQLAGALARAGKKPAIVFHHTPSVEDFYRNRMHDGWAPAVRKKWVDLINAYNVKAVLAGHFHRDEHHWIGRVPLYVSSSIAGMWGRQASFRIFEYRNGQLSYRTQYIE